MDTVKTPSNQPCDACGCSAEMGFMIKENDHVAQVIIHADSQDKLEAHFKPYLALAKSINSNVKHELVFSNENDIAQLDAQLEFECSAEKLIFELRSRSLNQG